MLCAHLREIYFIVSNRLQGLLFIDFIIEVLSEESIGILQLSNVTHVTMITPFS